MKQLEESKCRAEEGDEQEEEEEGDEEEEHEESKQEGEQKGGIRESRASKVPNVSGL